MVQKFNRKKVMPELPEVETVKRGLENAIVKKRIASVRINRYDLRVPIPDDFGQNLTSKTVEVLTRRGKYIVMTVGSEVSAILHLGMSGRIHIFSPGEDYVPQKHDHVILTIEDGTVVAFEDPRRFGMFYTVTNDWTKDRAFLSMGPEPLEEWSGEDLYAKLKNKKTIIKSALLDQRVVAGLGNIYVCEALHMSKIHPTRMSCDITENEAETLVQACRAVLLKAIEAGGSTLKDYKKTDGSLGYFQYQFSVYDQKGQSCCDPDCDGTIERIVQAGRSTFYCPSCQV